MNALLSLLRLTGLLLLGILLVAVSHLLTRQWLLSELREETHLQALQFKHQAETTLASLTLPVRILARQNTVRSFAARANPPEELNRYLSDYAHLIKADVVYLMDAEGTTVASSNADEPGSFVGKNYGFRPYFQNALQRRPGLYVAQGVTSNVVGLYLGQPVENDQREVVGVVAVKYPAEILLPPTQLDAPQRAIRMLVEENGITFAANHPALHLSPTRSLNESERQAIEKARKFPLKATTESGAPLSRDAEGWLRWEEPLPPDQVSTLPHQGLLGAKRRHFGELIALDNAPELQVGLLRPYFTDQAEYIEHFLENGLLMVLLYILVLVKLRAVLEKRRHLEQIGLLMRHVPVATALFDQGLRYLQASHRWLDDHNLDANQARGQSHFELVRNLPERWQEIFQRALQGKWERQEAEPFVTESGETEYITWEAFPWRQNRGEIGGVLLFKENVTQRVRMEEEVRRQRDRMAYEREFIEEVITRMRTSPHFDARGLRYLLAPVEKTAGDLLLSARREDGRWHVMLGDFTGHGLTAALGGPLVSDIFYAMTAKGLPMATLLTEINEQLNRKMPTGMFMAGIFLEMDETTGHLALWNCSMPEVLLFRGSTVHERLPSRYLPCGVLKEESYEADVVLLHPGDKVLLYSDGVADLMDPEGERLGQDALEQVMGQVLRNGEELEKLRLFLEAFRASKEQTDDISVVEVTLKA
ncbi:MAG: SpoIIE family protein phosphatase [Magnetococcales bacterium]|nr:SpoIIE family protein phosphatase [Magnetococcales bacterium]